MDGVTHLNSLTMFGALSLTKHRIRWGKTVFFWPTISCALRGYPLEASHLMQTTQRPKDVFWPDHPSGFLIIGSQNPTDRLMTILQYGYLIQFPTANMQIRSIHSQRPQAQVAGMSEYPTSDHGTQKHVYRWFCLSQQVPPGGRLLRQLVWLLCQLCCLGPIGAAGLCLAAIVLGNRFWKYQLSTKIAP